MNREEKQQLDSAAHLLADELERLAKKAAKDGDIFGVAFLCQRIRTIAQLPSQIERRFP